jgi:phospholipid/cholesterol/gamma-HCH transport system substrate-binding protein
MIHAVFHDLGGLEKSNDVKVNGYKVGKVYTIGMKDKNMDEFIVTINLNEDVHIPKDSKAIITSTLTGIWSINIAKGELHDFLKPGDTLATRLEATIVDDVKAQLTPTLEKVRKTLDSLNSVFGKINGVLNAEAKQNIQQTLANLNAASNSINGLLDNQNGALAKTLNNAEQLTSSLKENTDDIRATVGNAKKASEKLANLEIQPTIESLQETIKQLKDVVVKMNSKDGTLGALINDKALYNKLNDAILSAEILMDDLRTHPKRYVNLSIFGKKDKTGPITSPAIKDSVPK